MIDRKREIYIRLEKISEIVDVMMEIKQLEDKIKQNFKEYDKLLMQENKLFDNWSNYTEEVIQSIDHITL